MRRFNFFIEQKWVDRLKRDMAQHGFSNLSSFIRYIIIKFFDNKNLDGSEKYRYFFAKDVYVGSSPTLPSGR